MLSFVIVKNFQIIFDNMENAHDKIQKNQCIMHIHTDIYIHTYIYDSLNIIKIRGNAHIYTLWKKSLPNVC